MHCVVFPCCVVVIVDGRFSQCGTVLRTNVVQFSFLPLVFFFNHSVLNAHSHSAGVLQDKCCLLMVLSPHFSSSCPFKQVYRVSMMACCGTRSWQRRSQVGTDQGRSGCEWWRRSEFLGECISVFSSSLYSVFLVFRPVHSTSN